MRRSIERSEILNKISISLEDRVDKMYFCSICEKDYEDIEEAFNSEFMDIDIPCIVADKVPQLLTIIKDLQKKVSDLEDEIEWMES